MRQINPTKSDIWIIAMQILDNMVNKITANNNLNILGQNRIKSKKVLLVLFFCESVLV